MSVPVNVRMSKIMHTPIKIGVRTNMTWANCRNLPIIFCKVFEYEILVTLTISLHLDV